MNAMYDFLESAAACRLTREEIAGLSQKHLEILLQNHIQMLRHVALERVTYAFCVAAVTQRQAYLVPACKWDADLVKVFIENRCRSVGSIPMHLRTQELFEATVPISAPECHSWIPAQFRTLQGYIYIATHNPAMIREMLDRGIAIPEAAIELAGPV